MHLERADPICPRSALCGADRGSGQPLAERARSMTTGRQIHLRFMRPQVLIPISLNSLIYLITLYGMITSPEKLFKLSFIVKLYFIVPSLIGLAQMNFESL